MIEQIERKPSLPLWARIVLVMILFLIMTGIFQVIGVLIAGLSLTDPSAMENMGMREQLILQFSGFIGTALVVFLFRKYIDRKSIKSIGFSFNNRFKDIGLGFIYAVIILGLGSLILWVTGSVEFKYLELNILSIFMSFLLFIVVSLNEEIFVRGYLLNNLMTGMNKFWALLLSAAIFTSLHLLNPNLSVLGVTNLLLAGILLGASYIYTKNLWFPISLHLFWNFLQGPIFGYSVSGQNIKSLFSVELVGNETLNGGEFGFEGSLLCTIMLIVSIASIMVYYRKQELKTVAILQ